MKPVALRTARLVLDQPTSADVDVDAITVFCNDPRFEHFMTLPFPYSRDDATEWVDNVVPAGWTSDQEFTWAIRSPTAPGLIGAIGYRTGPADIGYWLGEPHRGNGFMTEAVGAVTSWLADRGLTPVHWECREGNIASAAVARHAGFRFTGSAPSRIEYRDGGHPPAWHGRWTPADVLAPSSWPDWTS